uniref:Chromosomal replication initiator protein dnaA n=1 Tax=Mycoplasmoides genitalium TaxID=2097 RepID=UPI000158A174|nr:Chain A, Chromosomal replication initiator protein dnaA [Mycoplasmoides genitalium]
MGGGGGGMEQFNAFKSLLKKHYEKTIGFHDKYIKDINRFVFKNNVLLILLENEFARNSLNDNSEIIHLAESLYEGIKSVNFVNEQDFFFNLAKLEENSRDTLYQNSG